MLEKGFTEFANSVVLKFFPAEAINVPWSVPYAFRPGRGSM